MTVRQWEILLGTGEGNKLGVNEGLVLWGWSSRWQGTWTFHRCQDLGLRSVKQ